jgi:hypothetical protein
VLSQSCRAGKRRQPLPSPDHSKRKGAAKATSIDITNPSRFHNLSDASLADAIGNADAIAKAAEAELKDLKDELKRRGVEEARGERFTVTAKEQISGRLDAKAVREFLGDTYCRFETAVVSTVVRVKAANRVALAA